MNNVVVIGAGNIGANYDRPDMTEILSHAHAIDKSTTFNLYGFVDNNRERCISAAKRWNTKWFLSLDECMNSGQIDVAVVAVPDEYHAEYLHKLLVYDLKIIILEKPVAIDRTQLDYIKSISTDTRILVNYSRRYDSRYIRLRECIKHGELGEFIGGSGYYGKGLKHNGSHMLDLLNYLIGRFDNYRVNGSIVDFKQNDPSLSLNLLYNEAVFTLTAIDSNYYTVFNMELYFKKAHVSIGELGWNIKLSKPMSSELLSDYIFLEDTKCFEGSTNNSMKSLYEHIEEVIESSEKAICSLEDGIIVLEQCLMIMEG